MHEGYRVCNGIRGLKRAEVTLALAKVQAASVVGTKEIVAAELVAKLKKMISLIMEAYELELRLLKQGGGGSNDLCGSGIQGY